jgi:hypothetical protein
MSNTGKQKQAGNLSSNLYIRFLQLKLCLLAQCGKIARFSFYRVFTKKKTITVISSTEIISPKIASTLKKYQNLKN